MSFTDLMFKCQTNPPEMKKDCLFILRQSICEVSLCIVSYPPRECHQNVQHCFIYQTLVFDSDSSVEHDLDQAGLFLMNWPHWV